MDSNHRRLSRRIYSPLHLTALPPLLNYYKDIGLLLKCLCVCTTIANNIILRHLSIIFFKKLHLFYAKRIFSLFVTASGVPTQNSCLSLMA